jgi:peptidoglycan/LPS O-acetylase OafA/YrhL
MHAVPVTSAASAWRLGHRPALDGLRGVAILLVVACHGGFAPTATGAVGVALFFVLSGFLITRLVLEAAADGRWSLPGFYGNRLARLAPALVVCLTVCTSWWILQGASRANPLAYSVIAVLYLSDLVYPHLVATPFGHTWSLAVEEQFYLIWPTAALLLAGRRRLGLWLIGGVATVSIALRLALWSDHPLTATGSPFTNAYALLLGCGLAFAAEILPAAFRWLEAVGLAALLVLVVSLVVLPAAGAVGPVLGAGISVALVWAAATSGRLLTMGWLRFVGRISYAWYLWHRPVLYLLHEDAKGLASLPGIVLSLGLAVASTLLLEEPVRRRWRARRERHGGDPYNRAPALAGGHSRGAE